jgi:membrane-anchored protein YejM (alkaline phosphatase superfamily)
MGWESGAPPLQLLKQWGYQIRLYTSAQLGYYGMGELLFGRNRALLDGIQEFHRPPPFSSADSDAQAMRALCLDLENNQALHQGQLMITFLDATHFHYSWPKDFVISFLPIANHLNVLQFIPIETELKKLQNRYRNAIQYVDSLFGQFLAKIPDPENAIIIVTSDHGEEYFEKGHLFHCSQISAEQTEIPLYMKLGTRKIESPPKLACHMDIFPTILHHVSNEPIHDFEGSSIFDEHRWPYVLISRFNGGRSPYEFCLHDGNKKLILQFDNRRDILSSKSLRICSLLDAKDACIYPCKSKIKKWVIREFDAGLLRLFPSSPEDEEIP